MTLEHNFSVDAENICTILEKKNLEHKVSFAREDFESGLKVFSEQKVTPKETKREREK